MGPIRITIAFIALLATFLTPAAHAAVHFWQIKEVFSTADGSVQFIEMFDNVGGEIFTQFNTLRAVSDGVTKDFVFPDNISGDTLLGHMLIATPGFGALPGGVTPEFTFDQSSVPFAGPFFNPNATNITITFLGSSDSISFTGATLPKNGINSLTDTNLAFPGSGQTLTVGINSPTNLNDVSDSVNPGDYNRDNVVNAADYVAWRNTLTQSVGQAGSGADGNISGTIDAADYGVWKAHFGNVAPVPAAGAGLDSLTVPEPVTPGLIIAGLMLLALGRRR